MNPGDEVARIVRRNLRLAEDHPLPGDLSFADDLGADSILVMGILVRVEETFGIELTAESVTRSDTLDGLVREVERALAGAGRR